MPGSNTKIYVVDDDTGLRTAYAASLHKMGYEVETAADGQQAEALVKKAKPGLILLDLLMPNMDGLSFLKNLRAEDKDNKIKVIVVSNFESMPEASELGVAKYLSKMQHGPDEIAAFVDQILKA
jgi:DNA-binding response OmpR family regulator